MKSSNTDLKSFKNEESHNLHNNEIFKDENKKIDEIKKIENEFYNKIEKYIVYGIYYNIFI